MISGKEEEENDERRNEDKGKEGGRRIERGRG